MTETDFPVLTCAVSCLEGKYSVVLGARPKHAFLVDGVELDHPEDETEVQAFAEKVVSQVEFGSNMRGSKEYRAALAKVLIKRCVQELVVMQ
jgi:CO/xanthine dehydrogenase FAD-binding subunit